MATAIMLRGCLVQLDHMHAKHNLGSKSDEEQSLEEARKQLSLVKRRPDTYEAASAVSLLHASIQAQAACYAQAGSLRLDVCVIQCSHRTPVCTEVCCRLQMQLTMEDHCLVCRDQPATIGFSHQNRCPCSACTAPDTPAMQGLHVL